MRNNVSKRMNYELFDFYKSAGCNLMLRIQKEYMYSQLCVYWMYDIDNIDSIHLISKYTLYI